MKTRITHVHARRIWDSRGRPTVEVDVTLQDGSKGTGMAPAGASRGSLHGVSRRRVGGKLCGWQAVCGKLCVWQAVFVGSVCAARLAACTAASDGGIPREGVQMEAARQPNGLEILVLTARGAVGSSGMMMGGFGQQQGAGARTGRAGERLELAREQADRGSR